MNFFQKVGNAFSRFMYGRNGADHLGMAALWLAILLDIVNIFVKNGHGARGGRFGRHGAHALGGVPDVLPEPAAPPRRERVVPHEVRLSPCSAAAAPAASSAWTRTTNTSPVPTAARSAASRAERARSSSPAPSATAKSTDGAERPTRPAAEPRGAFFTKKGYAFFDEGALASLRALPHRRRGCDTGRHQPSDLPRPVSLGRGSCRAKWFFATYTPQKTDFD